MADETPPPDSASSPDDTATPVSSTGPSLDEILATRDSDLDSLLQDSGSEDASGGGFAFNDHLAAMDDLHQKVSGGVSSTNPGGVSLGDINPDGSLKQDFGLNGPSYDYLHQTPKGARNADGSQPTLPQAFGLNALPDPNVRRGQAYGGVTYPGSPAVGNVPTSVNGRTKSLESGLDALQAKSSPRPDTRFAGIVPPPKPGVQVPPPIPPSPVPSVPLPPLPPPVVPPKTY